MRSGAVREQQAATPDRDDAVDAWLVHVRRALEGLDARPGARLAPQQVGLDVGGQSGPRARAGI